MEDVPLVKVDGDECLKFRSFDLLEVLRCHVDELGQHVQEQVVCLGHDLLVRAGAGEGHLCIASPNELDAQNANLWKKKRTDRCLQQLWRLDQHFALAPAHTNENIPLVCLIRYLCNCLGKTIMHVCILTRDYR